MSYLAEMAAQRGVSTDQMWDPALASACGEVDRLRAASSWRIGIPDVPEGKERRFLCSVNGGKGVALLMYCNKHWAPIGDGVEPAEDALTNDDGEAEWNGWFQESCDQCETFWSWSGTVDAWMPLPGPKR